MRKALQFPGWASREGMDPCLDSSSLGQATEALRHVRRSLYLRMQVEELEEKK